MTPRAWRFRYASEAVRHVEEIAEWWGAHRPLTSGLFAAEMDQCCARLAILPYSGAPHPHRAVPGLRRALLRATRYHVYYSVDEVANCIIIRAVWHATRGSPPHLG